MSAGLQADSSWRQAKRGQYFAPGAVLAGELALGAAVSVWFSAVKH